MPVSQAVAVRTGVAALLGLVVLLSVGAATAQDDAPEGGDMPGVEISDADIDAFVAALGEVQALGEEWTERMRAAESERDIADMRETAREEMMRAIEDHGLTVEQYNQIATAAQDDPELAQRIQQAIAER